MTRIAHILAYAFLVCALIAALVSEVLVGDAWRSGVLAVGLVVVLVVRRDLTEPAQ